MRARLAGTSNASLGGAKYVFGGVYFAFFTVNTAKYSPKYSRIANTGRIWRPCQLACVDASAMGIGHPHVRAALPPLGAAEGGLVAEHTVAAVPHQESALKKWSCGGPGMKRSRHHYFDYFELEN